MSILFIDPKTGLLLHTKDEDKLVSSDGTVIAIVKDSIPRFVDSNLYADNFGYQWNKWEDILSDQRSLFDHKYNEIVKRTHFDQLETKDKTVLECGCGGGDDTEVLLKMPFGEIYSFDLSNAVDRAYKFLGQNNLYEKK